MTHCLQGRELLQGWGEAEIGGHSLLTLLREDVQTKSDGKASLGGKTVDHLTENNKRRTRLSVGAPSLFISQSSNLSELLRQHKFISNCAICYLGKSDKS